MTRLPDPFPSYCERCHASLTTSPSTMSMFNTDTICMACKARERAHPDYPAAAAAELAAVQAGNMNFAGVGTTASLYEPAERNVVWETHKPDRHSYFKAKVLYCLQPGHFGARLTLCRLEDIIADPERLGYSVSHDELENAVAALMVGGQIVKAGRCYVLASHE